MMKHLSIKQTLGRYRLYVVEDTSMILISPLMFSFKIIVSMKKQAYYDLDALGELQYIL